jgi:hypothetical protein
MNSLQELNEWIEKIKNLNVDDDNIDLLNNFIRFSPEKFSDKLGLEREPLVKEFDKHKKEVHNKVIIYNRVKVLKKRKLETFTFKYNGKPYPTKFCVCTKFLQVKSNAKFYPTITYLYCELEGFFANENLVVFAENQKVYITENEFNENFIDLREYKINSIINT